jgi:hypothetical protein
MSHESQIGFFLAKQGMNDYCKGLSTPMEGYASADADPEKATDTDNAVSLKNKKSRNLYWEVHYNYAYHRLQ